MPPHRRHGSSRRQPVAQSTAVAILLLAGLAEAAYLGGIRLDLPSPSYLPHGAFVEVTIDYKIDAPEGARIFVVPFTNGAQTPHWQVSSSPMVPAGSGTITRSLSILQGEPLVDQVRVSMVNEDQSITYLELFVPVAYQFGPQGVYDLQPSFSRHSRLPHGRPFTVEFTYAVDAPGCRIFARPFTDGVLTPGYSASPAPALPPSGTASQFFYFNSDADVTHIRFQILDLDQNLLAEYFVPFAIHWRSVGIYNIAIDRENQASLHNSQQVTGSFTFEHDDPAGMTAFVYLYRNGSLIVDQVFQPSTILPPGTHDLTRWARYPSGSIEVDAVGFAVFPASGPPAVEFFTLPRTIFYGPHAIGNVTFSPASPAILSHGERLNMSFDYLTDEAGGVRIFPRAAYQGSVLSGAGSSGSALYPAPGGSGSAWTHFNQDRIADSVRFLMVNADQSEQLLTWFAPGSFVWGDAGTLTGVEPVPPRLALLGHAYPNPFNPTATIPVTLARASMVDLAIYDARGRLVQQLHRGELPAGDHRFTVRGEGLSSGAYICRLVTPAGTQSQRLTLIK